MLHFITMGYKLINNFVSATAPYMSCTYIGLANNILFRVNMYGLCKLPFTDFVVVIRSQLLSNVISLDTYEKNTIELFIVRKTIYVWTVYISCKFNLLFGYF